VFDFFFWYQCAYLGATMVSGQFQHCTTIRDCTINLLCKIGETEQCFDNQCKCAPTPQIQVKLKSKNLKTTNCAQTCKVTSDCDPSMKPSCVSGSYICFNTF
ncbi:unnamed protein product, partial [Brassica oleracea]